METSTPIPPPTSSLPRLFPPPSIFLASLLGTPIAGSLLLTYNALRLKQRVGAVIALAMGFLVSITLLGLVPYIPRNAALFVFLPAGAFAMSLVTNILQGDSLAAHRAAAGPNLPFILTPLIGLLVTACLYAAYILLLHRANHLTPYTLAPNQTLLYSDYTITPADAEHNAKILQTLGLYAPVSAHMYILTRAQNRWLLWVPFDPAKVDSPEVAAAFQSLVEKLTAAGFPQPFTLLLTDPNRHPLKQFPSTQPASH